MSTSGAIYRVRMKRPTRFVLQLSACLAAAATLIAGSTCLAILVIPLLAEGPFESEAPPGGASDFMRLMRGTAPSGFESYESPAEMVSDSAIIVHGTIASVEAGRVYPTDDPIQHIMLAIRPDEVLSDDPGRRGRRVYIELPWPEGRNLVQIADTLPAAAEVAVFAHRWDDPGVPVLAQGAARPSGAPVYTPLVQGLWMSDGTKLTSVLTSQEVSEGAWSGVDSWPDLKKAARNG